MPLELLKPILDLELKYESEVIVALEFIGLGFLT